MRSVRHFEIVLAALSMASLCGPAIAQGTFLKKKPAAVPTPASAPKVPAAAPPPAPAPKVITPPSQVGQKASSLPAKAQPAQSASALDFVTSIYGADFAQHLSRDRVYSRSLASLMAAAAKRQDPLEYNPLCGCQDSDGLSWTAAIFDEKPSSARSIITVDHTKKITLLLVREPAGWRVADVQSANTPSLAATLRPQPSAAKGRKIVAPSARTPATPLIPIVMPAGDAGAFEAAALCRSDITPILSHFKPSGRGRNFDVYLLPPGTSVNGGPAIASLYQVRSSPFGPTQFLMTLVQAPQEALVPLARTQKWLRVDPLFGDAAALGDSAEAQAIAKRGNFPWPATAPAMGVTPTPDFMVSSRRREISQISVLPQQRAMLVCRQYQQPGGGQWSWPSQYISPAADLPKGFADGSLRITRSAKGACDQLYKDPATAAKLDDFVRVNDWNNVVRHLTSLQCKSDYAYLLLGRAAELMQLRTSALNFYNEASKLTSNGLSFSTTTQCAVAANFGCRGLTVSAETAAGIDRMMQTPVAMGPYQLRPMGLSPNEQDITPALK